MWNDTRIAVDVAKAVVEIAISDRPGHVKRRERLPCVQFVAFMAQQPKATVTMEACGCGRTLIGQVFDYRSNAAAGARGAEVGHMGVDHGRRQVCVAEERLEGANVAAGLEEVGRERVVFAPSRGRGRAWWRGTPIARPMPCRRMGALAPARQVVRPSPRRRRCRLRTAGARARGASQGLDPRQNGADLVAREHDRQPGGSFRAHEVVEPREILLRDFPVEKQERGEGLVQGGGGDAAGIGERVEKPRGELSARFIPVAPARSEAAPARCAPIRRGARAGRLRSCGSW
jgi:hypothetical protein